MPKTKQSLSNALKADSTKSDRQQEKGGTTQLTNQTEDAKSMQKGQRLHHHYQRSSPPPRAPRLSSPRPRVSPNPAEKEKTEQHRTANKSQTPKCKGTTQTEPKHIMAKQSPAGNT